MPAGARYLVTGGAGFIGSHIASALLARGDSVRIFDNLSSGKEANVSRLDGNVQFLRGDLRDPDSVRAAVSSVEVVFHQGAVASVQASMTAPIESMESNLNGTLHVLLAAREAGVRRVINASSSAVYGDATTVPKREDMPSQPVSPYGVQKLASEHLCWVFTHLYGLETVSLRYFNVFGPGQDPGSDYAAVIPRFIAALLSGERPTVFGDGEQTRDFTYVDNVVRANLLAAVTPHGSGAVLNIGSGRQTSLNTLLQLAISWLGTSIEPEYLPSRPGDVQDSVADISLAHQLLGYVPEISFEEGLRRTIEAMNTSVH